MEQATGGHRVYVEISKEAAMFKHILVPIDGSELSQAAVRAACGFARLCGARLTFYHAKPGYFPGNIGGEMAMAGPGIDEAFQAAQEARSQAILADAARQAEAAGAAYTTRSTATDAPHEGILEAAEAGGCDLILLASHGRRGLGALLLGSETQKVLTHCKVPVLVYR